MVVVSHLFLFLWESFGADATRMSHICPYLELSISRQPLLCIICIQIDMNRVLIYDYKKVREYNRYRIIR